MMLNKFDKETVLRLKDKETGIETDIIVMINVLKPVDMFKTLMAFTDDYEMEVIKA